MLIAGCSISFLARLLPGNLWQKDEKTHITVLLNQPTKIPLGMKKITRKNAPTQNSGPFPLNYGNLAVNMLITNFST